MGLYSGGPIIGRISASEIWGAYFSEGLFIYLFSYLFFLFWEGGGYYRNFTVFDKGDFLLLTQKSRIFSSFTAKNTYSTEKLGSKDAESHEASTDKEIQELTDAVMETFSLENPIMFDKYNINANSCARLGYCMRSVLLWNLMYLQ